MRKAIFYSYDEYFDWLENVLKSAAKEESDMAAIKEKLEKACRRLFKEANNVVVGSITLKKVLNGFIFSKPEEFADWCWNDYGKEFVRDLGVINERLNEQSIKVSHKKTLSGRVLIIDPGYVFPDGLWDKLVEILPSVVNNFYEINGHRLYIASTAYGDGTFPVHYGSQSKKVGVDSGLLSAIPVDTYRYLLRIGGSDNASLGVWVDLGSEPQEVYYRRGDWSIGDIVEVITS